MMGLASRMPSLVHRRNRSGEEQQIWGSRLWFVRMFGGEEGRGPGGGGGRRCMCVWREGAA